jgi:hypothetical protein
MMRIPFCCFYRAISNMVGSVKDVDRVKNKWLKIIEIFSRMGRNHKIERLPSKMKMVTNIKCYIELIRL